MLLGENGVQTEFMKASFPTLTFPNHYTLVTGLYPSSHGIVANMFYDPDLGEDFNYRIPSKSWNPKWWGGESVRSSLSLFGL
jgi:predicted AlkP superfamily pyrophosphatase or phosphodiesterase